jgi:hypothetical protein
MSYAVTLAEEFGSLKSLSRIADALTRTTKDWLEKFIDDDDYQILSGFLHLKQKAVRNLDTVAMRMPSLAAASREAGFVSYFPKRKPIPKSPDLRVSYERRAELASLRPLPSKLERQFTMGARAVLKIVGDEVRAKGLCMLYLGEIAARAGVCLTTARNTIRDASFMGLVTIQERKQHKKPNLANIVRIISAEWRDWIKSGNYYLHDFLRSALKANPFRGGASKKLVSTDEDITYPNGERLVGAQSGVIYAVSKVERPNPD